jgi:hypothetical protein
LFSRHFGIVCAPIIVAIHGLTPRLVRFKAIKNGRMPREIGVARANTWNCQSPNCAIGHFMINDEEWDLNSNPTEN